MLSVNASTMFVNEVWPEFASRLKTESSVRCYESVVNEMMNYLKKDILDMSESDIDSYFTYLSSCVDSGKIKEITKAVKIRWMNSLFNYLSDNKERYKISTGPFFNKYLGELEKVSPAAKMVPLEDIDKLFQAAKDDLMEYCILLMLFRAGFTTTEISNIRPGDIVSYENGVISMSGKGPRLIPDDVAAILDLYYKERKNTEYLFTNRQGTRLSRMYFTRMLKKYIDKAGIEECTCRSIRNTCGAIMFSYGVDGRVVAKQLGITTKHIKRFNDMYYKDRDFQDISRLVKINVKFPEEGG